MKIRSLVPAAVLAAALVGAAPTMPAAHAEVPQSTVCTARGSCVTVTVEGPNTFAFTVTCNAKEVILAGVRGFAESGAWTDSGTRLVTCTAMGAGPIPFLRTYFGTELVGHQVYTGLTWKWGRPTFGPYAGTSVPEGGPKIAGPGHGFHWD